MQNKKATAGDGHLDCEENKMQEQAENNKIKRLLRVIVCMLLISAVSLSALPLFSSLPVCGTACAAAKNAATVQKNDPVTKKQVLSALSKVRGGKALRTFNTSYRLGRTKSGRKLMRYVKKMQRRYGKFRFVVVDIKSGEGFSCDAKKKTYSASCLKGPYVAALCKYKPWSYKKSKWNMRRTIVVSNNDTYLSLRLRYGSKVMKKLMRSSRVHSFSAARRYTYVPPRDLAKLWVSVYWYFYRDKNKVSRKCRALYTHGYQSFIYRAMKGRFRVHAKPGWFPGGGYNVQNDAGIIMAKVKGKSRPYVVCVMTSACGRHKQLRKLVRLINNVHTDMCKQSMI